MLVVQNANMHRKECMLVCALWPTNVHKTICLGALCFWLNPMKGAGALMFSCFSLSSILELPLLEHFMTGTIFNLYFKYFQFFSPSSIKLSKVSSCLNLNTLCCKRWYMRKQFKIDPVSTNIVSEVWHHLQDWFKQDTLNTNLFTCQCHIIITLLLLQ